MLEFIFQFLGEILLQIVVEVLVELGFHSVREPLRRQVNPVVAIAGYAIFGATLGGLSLLVLPELLVPEQWRLLNLFLSPILAGLVMVCLGAWRARRGDGLLRIDRFAFGYIFALALALVRFQFAW
jgi:hypothetical protein